MRTTITLADDVAASIEKVRKERDLGLSEAVNDLIRAGLTSERETHVFHQVSHDMGIKIDVSNIGDALEVLEGPAAR